MCIKCAFNLKDKPVKCLECSICIRNPENMSKKFKPLQYKGFLIRAPIDMHISKEFWAILMEDLKKKYEEGYRKGNKDNRFETWYTQYHTFSTINSPTIPSQNVLQFTSDPSINITYTVSLGTIVPSEIKPSHLELPDKQDKSKEKKEKKDEKEEKKNVHLNPKELFDILEGVEVSDSV